MAKQLESIRELRNLINEHDELDESDDVDTVIASGIGKADVDFQEQAITPNED